MLRYGTHTLGVRGTAVLLSVAVHAALFWQYRDALWTTPAAAERPVIVARLSLPAPAETLAPKKPPAEKPRKPVVKPKPVAKPSPKPRPKPKALQPVPVAEVSKPAEPEPLPIEQTVEPEPTPEANPQQASSPSALALTEPAAPIVSEQMSNDEALEVLQHYLAELRAAIAAQKQYPALARRRGIEGEVKVTFTLLADGSVRDLRVSGGPRPLRSAARQAVRRAVQLPPPPAGVPSPMPVQYAMNFTLR